MSRVLLIAGAAGVGLAALYIVRKGGVQQAAQAVGAGAVEAVGGAASGAVGAIGASVGLPTPSQTTTDAAVARWLIDNAGHMEASKWSGAVAYGRALFMDAGSGTPPPAGSDLARQFAHLLGPRPTDTGDETARLLNRYPAPYVAPWSPDGILNGGGGFSDVLNGGGTTWGTWGTPPPFEG